MMMKKFWLVLTLMAMTSVPGFGQDDNVYIKLYTERVNFAKAEVRSQEAETEFQLRRLDRARRLLAQNAMAREEFERIETDYKKSVAEVDVRKARVGEEEASLEVVRHLVQNSQPVPLCRD